MNTFQTSKYIWQILSRKRKFQFLICTMIMILSALFESFSIAAIIPLLNSFTDSTKLLNNQFIDNILKIFNFNGEKEILIFVILVFCFLNIFSSIISVINIKLNFRFSSLVGHDVCKKLYKKILNTSYINQINTKSSDEIISVTTHIDNLIVIVSTSLTVIANLLISTSIIIFLFFISPQILLISFILFSLAYLFISIKSKKTLLRMSKEIVQIESKLINQVQETIGAKKEIILRSLHKSFFFQFKRKDYELRNMRSEISFLGTFPRYLLESAGIVILSLAFLFLTFGNIEKSIIIATLGVFALGSQKLLPAFQKIYFGWYTLKRFSSTLNSIFDVLSIQEKDDFVDSDVKPHVLEKSIRLANVSFKFNENEKFVLKNINMELKKGENVGIIGQTGCGKSTLIDIISGFLAPTLGQVFVDGVDIYNPENINFLNSWRNSIGYVSQNIFLLDSTIENNITLNFMGERVHHSNLKNSIAISQLRNYIKSLKKGTYTVIGERGINLSGGQKQRIAIARAIYHQPNILILDEATSALDNQTEKKIMNSINNFSKEITTIMIAHRLTSLKYCDRKISINEAESEEK